MKPVAQCKSCKKTISTAEIEVGTSLICPSCNLKLDKKTKSAEEDSRNNPMSEEKKKAVTSD